MFFYKWHDQCIFVLQYHLFVQDTKSKIKIELPLNHSETSRQPWKKWDFCHHGGSKVWGKASSESKINQMGQKKIMVIYSYCLHQKYSFSLSLYQTVKHSQQLGQIDLSLQIYQSYSQYENKAHSPLTKKLRCVHQKWFIFSQCIPKVSNVKRS